MAAPSTRFVKVTSGFVLGGGRPSAAEGDVIELPNAFAREVVACNKAVFCDPPVAATEVAESAASAKPGKAK